MPTRHEKDMSYTPLSVKDVASQFGLTEEETSMMQTMDKRFPEIADYRGYPEIQAEWIADHRNIIEERLALGSDYAGFIGIGLSDEEAGIHEVRSVKDRGNSARAGRAVVRLANRETSVDLALTG